MGWFQQDKDTTLVQLEEQLKAVKRKDPLVIGRLEAVSDGDFAGLSTTQKLSLLEGQISASINFVRQEQHRPEEIYNSRDPFGGLIQSVLNDDVLPQMQASGQGNP